MQSEEASRSESLLRRLADLDPVDLALGLSLLTVLLRPVGGPELRPVILLLAAAGLLLPGVRRSPLLWATLTALTALRVALDWPLGDNHAYLLAYWCLAVSIGLALRDTGPVCTANARGLIGLTFAFAALWKGLSPDFLDGTFFQVTLLSDTRFAGLASELGVSPAERAVWSERLAAHVDWPVPLAEAPALPEGLAEGARLAARGALLLEAAVALAFLWPGQRFAGLRDVLLLVFCLGTYALAPVRGFGWLLLSMGIAQTGPAAWVRPLYLAAYGAIVLQPLLPWAVPD